MCVCVRVCVCVCVRVRARELLTLAFSVVPVGISEKGGVWSMCIAHKFKHSNYRALLYYVHLLTSF